MLFNVSDRLCRTGCNVVETATHVVQVCFRTHEGRVKRHDAVSKTFENRIITSEGLRKSDIICQKQSEVWVIDTQVVGF